MTNYKNENFIHEQFMKEALKEAKKAEALDEIPIGAVIVRNNKIISSGYNTNRTSNNPTRHAEIIAIEKAAKVLENERLVDCDLYVTKEPCAMCAGAIIHSRIKNLYIGAADEKYGACGTKFNICGNNEFNHSPNIFFNILKDDCSKILINFFKKLRLKK